MTETQAGKKRADDHHPLVPPVAIDHAQPADDHEHGRTDDVQVRKRREQLLGMVEQVQPGNLPVESCQGAHFTLVSKHQGVVDHWTGLDPKWIGCKARTV